jgi:hypothetical protein
MGSTGREQDARDGRQRQERGHGSPRAFYTIYGGGLLRMRNTKCAVRCSGLIAALLLAGPAVFATDFDFSGEFIYDNDVALLDFRVGAASTVTVFTSSWIQGNPPLGFDPQLGAPRHQRCPRPDRARALDLASLRGRRSGDRTPAAPPVGLLRAG